MTWAVYETNRFKRAYKRLSPAAVRAVDSAIEKIAADPSVGTKKNGDLARLYVYKFRHEGQLYLLGYVKNNEIKVIYLESIGSHENFYKNLKN
ncbi:MAG: type II toxin-antitoxin system RelE/ParE family toxin [Micrococcales bacterium]